MSGMTEVNKIAAEAVSGGDEAIAELIATGLGLIHVLQVYTSSMVCFYLCVHVPLLIYFSIDGRRGMGLACMPEKYAVPFLIICACAYIDMLGHQVEYDRIWKRKWSLVKFLYLWTRYYGLLCFALNLWLFNDNFTFQACKKLWVQIFLYLYISSSQSNRHYLIAATCMWTTLGSGVSSLPFRDDLAHSST